MSFMLIVTKNTFMLNAIMLNVARPSVVAPTKRKIQTERESKGESERETEIGANEESVKNRS